MPIELPDDDEFQATANPLSKKAEVVLQQASQYEGKFGAARGPGAISVVVLPGRGLITDTVTIVDDKGTKKVSTYLISHAWCLPDHLQHLGVQAEIPYRELHSFHVISGAGSRKPGISFEHKPKLHEAGRDIRVWMKAELATDCAEKLSGMLQALSRQHEFEKEFKTADGDDT